MTDFFEPEIATDRVNDIVRGWAGGFIDEQGTIERFKFAHEKLFIGIKSFFKRSDDAPLDRHGIAHDAGS